MTALIDSLSLDSKRRNFRNSYFWIIGVFYLFQGFYLSGIMTYGSVRMSEWAVPVTTQTLMLPWLLVARSGGGVPLIFACQFLSGIGYGLGNVIVFTIAMRLCPASIEGFMFCTFMSFSNIGEYALGANVIAGLSGAMGGIIPSFFTLLPFSLLALLFVSVIIGALKKGAVPLGTTPLPEAE